MGFPGGSGKESSCQCRRPGFDPCVGKIPWRSKWQPTPVFLPGKSHGQRRLAGCGPWCCKRDTTQRLNKFMIVRAQSFTYLMKLSCDYFLVMLFAPATVCFSPPGSRVESPVCLSLCLSNLSFLTAGSDHALLPVDICSCLLFLLLQHLIFCLEIQLCKHLETGDELFFLSQCPQQIVKFWRQKDTPLIAFCVTKIASPQAFKYFSKEMSFDFFWETRILQQNLGPNLQIKKYQWRTLQFLSPQRSSAQTWGP